MKRERCVNKVGNFSRRAPFLVKTCGIVSIFDTPIRIICAITLKEERDSLFE